MPSPPAHAFLPLALASLSAPAPGRDSPQRRGGPATGSEVARAWQKGARELYFLFHFGRLGRERKREEKARRVFSSRTVLHLLDPLLPPIATRRLSRPCSCTMQQRQGESSSLCGFFRSSHLGQYRAKKKTSFRQSSSPFQPSSLSPSMGDDHGPAVGDDFKFSTGLTTAGENSLERGLQRDGVGNRGEQDLGQEILSAALLPLPPHLLPSFFLTPLPPPPSRCPIQLPFQTEAAVLLEQYGRNELQEKKQSK